MLNHPLACLISIFSPGVSVLVYESLLLFCCIYEYDAGSSWINWAAKRGWGRIKWGRHNGQVPYGKDRTCVMVNCCLDFGSVAGGLRGLLGCLVWL
ncbi:hypothetical protein V8C26DRAFT_417521 [Trichoderma gracile]